MQHVLDRRFSPCQKLPNWIECGTWGFSSLLASDIAENGHVNPILIEDQYDLRDATRLQGISIRGGVVEGLVKNSYNQGGLVWEGASFPQNELALVQWKRDHLRG